MIGLACNARIPGRTEPLKATRQQLSKHLPTSQIKRANG